MVFPELTHHVTSVNASYTAGIERGSSPSASGSEDVLRGAHQNRRRTGLRWARSTEADGEGDVREPRDTKSAPPSLDNGPLIDGFVSPRRSSMRRFLLGNTVKERMVRESNRFPPFELAREWMALVGAIRPLMRLEPRIARMAWIRK